MGRDLRNSLQQDLSLAMPGASLVGLAKPNSIIAAKSFSNTGGWY